MDTWVGCCQANVGGTHISDDADGPERAKHQRAELLPMKRPWGSAAGMQEGKIYRGNTGRHVYAHLCMYRFRLTQVRGLLNNKIRSSPIQATHPEPEVGVANHIETPTAFLHTIPYLCEGMLSWSVLHQAPGCNEVRLQSPYYTAAAPAPHSLHLPLSTHSAISPPTTSAINVLCVQSLYHTLFVVHLAPLYPSDWCWFQALQTLLGQVYTWVRGQPWAVHADRYPHSAHPALGKSGSLRTQWVQALGGCHIKHSKGGNMEGTARPTSKSMFRPQSIPMLYPCHTELGVPFSQL